MEIAIAVFIGLWIAGASICAYRHMKKEYILRNKAAQK